jgi:hypothetical protein
MILHFCLAEGGGIEPPGVTLPGFSGPVGQELFQALSTFLDFALGHGPKRSTSGVRGQDKLNVVVPEVGAKAAWRDAG